MVETHKQKYLMIVPRIGRHEVGHASRRRADRPDVGQWVGEFVPATRSRAYGRVQATDTGRAWAR